MSDFFLCPYCHRRTHHPEDIRHRYCPCCGGPDLLKGCVHRPIVTHPRPPSAPSTPVARTVAGAGLSLQAGILVAVIGLGAVVRDDAPLLRLVAVGVIGLVLGVQVGVLWALNRVRGEFDVIRTRQRDLAARALQIDTLLTRLRLSELDESDARTPAPTEPAPSPTEASRER